MVTKIGTSRSKTRQLLKKPIRKQGKISIRNYFSSYKDGDHVGLSAEPAIQNGMYHPRFYGRTGNVVGQRGRCYLVTIKDGGKNALFSGNLKIDKPWRGVFIK